MKHLILAYLATAILLPLTMAVAANPAPPPFPDSASVLTDAGNITTARYPDADTVLVDDLVHERYNPDGTSIAWDDEYTKILTEKGRRDSSTRSLWFHQPYGTATIVRAELFKPDGRCVAIDVAKQSRVMIDAGQMGANIYDPNSKVLQLSIAGLEIGDICHILVQRDNYKARVANTWGDYNVFEGDAPIRKLTYEVSAPDVRPLQHRLLRDPVTNTVSYTSSTQPDARTLHRWVVCDVPQIFPEPDMPELQTVAQRLLLSTSPDWPTVSRWYWELCQPPLAATVPEMAVTVSNLVNGVTERDERIRRIFKFVSQNIRYMGITTENVAPGYEPHEVGITFKNRYGVCRDKAALLVAMLRLAGLEAYPVLIHAGAKMDPTVPVPFFNHAIVAVTRPDGSYQLMDPTNENTRDLFPAYLCNRSYLVAHPRGEPLRVSEVDPAERNLLRVASFGELDATGTLTYRTRIAFDGINDTIYRGHLLKLKPDQRRKFFEGLMKNRLAGAELTEFALLPDNLQDTAQPLTAALTCRARDWPIRGNGLDVAALPWLGTSLGYVNFVVGATGLKTRKYPLETGVACGIDETIDLDVAAGLGAPRQIPDRIAFDRSGIIFALDTQATNGHLKGALRYLVRQPEFTPIEYLDLRHSLQDIEFAARRRPTFEHAGGDKPDVCVLRDETRIELTSPQAWTTTRTTTRQVLTYAGKKRSSELKLSYNPAWQSVELISAVVSNQDGSVHTVMPQEINCMDAGWAGGAPRYPAGKTMVVSLPGVETGSVICVITRFSQTNASFFSIEHAFGGFEPVAYTALEIAATPGLPLAVTTCHNAALHETVFQRDHMTVRRWETGPLAATRNEENLPPWGIYRPMVFASTGDWPTHTAHLHQAFEKAMRHQSQAEARARAIVTELPSAPSIRIRALRDEVLRTIRLAGPSFLDLPLACLTPADRTLTDGYGHQADRMILLATMLRAVGFVAEPVLAASSARLPEDAFAPLQLLPQSGLYGMPLVHVTPLAAKHTYHLLGSRFSGLAGAIPPLFIGDGDQYTPLGATAFHRHPYLNLNSKSERKDTTGKTGRVTVAAQYRNHNLADWTVELDRTGRATITVTNWFYGTACGSFRKQYDEMPPEDRRRHHLELVSGISRAAEAMGDLITDTYNYPGYRAFTVQAERYAIADGRLLTVLLPDTPGQILKLNADQRVNPLFSDDFTDLDWTCRLILPAMFSHLPVMPPAGVWDLPNGLGRVEASTTTATRTDGRTEITFRRTIRMESAILAPELYPALIEFNRKLQHPNMRTVVAEATGHE